MAAAATANPNAPPAAKDAVPTVEITANSSIKSKVRQCLAILQVPSEGEPAPTATTRKAARKGNRIVALKAVHPSAGSKTITVAEIAKRCIAAAGATDGKGATGTWWQYTKLESSLIEWPPKKQTKTKTDPPPRPTAAAAGNTDREKEQQEELDADALLNASKRRRSVIDERAAKKRKLDHSDIEPSPPRPVSVDLSSDDRPPHLRHSSPAASSDSIPPHLRSSSPAARSDSSSIPPHLRHSPPAAGSDDSIPPHLRSSTPTPKPSSPARPSASTARNQPDSHTANATREDPPVTSSPPPMVDEQMESDDDEDGDEYRDFQQLDLDHVPEKYTKKLLADLDEAERRRKKYRAVAVMTIYLSLQRRGDLEKLYGVQTNFEVKAKDD
ncbi:hypothetical protein Dda_4602 [Drechslerella dactyloides]|uniref:Uncharacterized protein n=1 Tax=Drechslerella dactyloides TaxID=74499 RepID=A0AAD6IXM4_DREDA|nr:hypothetical protein Dda_4602 [Drechslerella dactyloides]